MEIKTYTKQWKEKDGTVRSATYEYKRREKGFRSSPLWIALPDKTDDEHYEWHRLPDDIYKHKGYPVCKCGKVFVPINDGDTECFTCQFTKK